MGWRREDFLSACRLFYAIRQPMRS
jgi:hypothetical protein